MVSVSTSGTMSKLLWVKTAKLRLRCAKVEPWLPVPLIASAGCPSAAASEPKPGRAGLAINADNKGIDARRGSPTGNPDRAVIVPCTTGTFTHDALDGSTAVGSALAKSRQLANCS